MRAWWAGSIAMLTACSEPSLDFPSQPPPLEMTWLPAAEPSAVPPGFRARVRGAGGGEAWLLRGELSDYHARAVRRGVVAESLRELAVPLRFWSEGADLWLQALVWLEPGQRYSLALSGHGLVQSFQVAASSGARAERYFPSPSRPVQRVAAFCGPGLPAEAQALVVEPGRVPVRTVPVPAPLVEAQDCVAYVVEQELAEPAVLPPGSGGLLLAPTLFGAGASASDVEDSCSAGLREGGGCIEVLDDRILVTALAEDALWLLDEPAARAVVARAGSRTALVRDLPAQSPVKLRGTVLTVAGAEHALALTLTTLAPQPHLMLTEVLANPLGAEPGGEWVELHNDSTRSAPLAGLWLADSAGQVALPDEALAPGEIALLVPRGFTPGGLDVTIPAQTRRLELESLGTRGLSNAGEALTLLGPAGVLSRFPALAAPNAGRSLVRLDLDAQDDDPTAFAEHAAPGASPGAPAPAQ